jgi:hypothetical protein
MAVCRWIAASRVQESSACLFSQHFSLFKCLTPNNWSNSQFERFHNLTNGPFSPRTGSVFGTFTSGIVFNALA